MLQAFTGFSLLSGPHLVLLLLPFAANRSSHALHVEKAYIFGGELKVRIPVKRTLLHIQLASTARSILQIRQRHRLLVWKRLKLKSPKSLPLGWKRRQGDEATEWRDVEVLIGEERGQVKEACDLRETNLKICILYLHARSSTLSALH